MTQSTMMAPPQQQQQPAPPLAAAGHQQRSADIMPAAAHDSAESDGSRASTLSTPEYATARPPPQPPSLQPAPPQLADREEGAAMLQMMANASELRVPAPSPAPSSST